MGQKRLARAIKRARKIGLMPHMSKLLLLDEETIRKRQQELDMKKFVEAEREEYDSMGVDDLRTMYPEYAPLNSNGQGTESERERSDSELVVDFSREYEIEQDELIYQTQLRKQQNLFMKQIKKDIIQKIPEYWQKRLSFRDKSNELVNRLYNQDKEKKKNRAVARQQQQPAQM